MSQDDYRRLMAFASATSREIGEPIFYRERQREIAVSESILASSKTAQAALAIISRRELSAGHGVEHAWKVARDAGAIVIIELGEKNITKWQTEAPLAHLAGLLHDVCRGETDHARKGADEAARILANFPADAGATRRIKEAIGAHEAFQEGAWEGVGEDTLLASALYDADKFRWGPDNFTTTLWEMISASGYPLEKLLARWERGMEGIKRVRGSFRSDTGKLYGPDFIDRGIVIGTSIYNFLRQECG